MTPAQQKTIDLLKSEGFRFSRNYHDMVLMTRGADNRLVRHDGSQRRAQRIFSRGCN
ncbi:MULTISPECIES: hypothetical protein [unclassified Pseudomonas]|uniref:hypothetical protein n=1 Tax=unclassified Pseudomonas TaxID=196821 RepID=UPI0025FA0B35|nr:MULTISPECIES: hypothetical protein [unclassified Pseudomonas]